jgi:hypothetical protein
MSFIINPYIFGGEASYFFTSSVNTPNDGLSWFSNIGRLNEQKFAISLWFKNFSSSSDKFLIGYYDAPVSAGGYNLRQIGGANMNFIVTSGSNVTNGSITFGISGTDWAHLLIHYDSANGTSSERLKGWLNGSPIASGISLPTDTSGMDFGWSSVTPVIGQQLENGSKKAGTIYDGKIFQLAHFSNSLPALSDVVNTSPSLTRKPSSQIAALPGAFSVVCTRRQLTNPGFDYKTGPNWSSVDLANFSSDLPPA